MADKKKNNNEKNNSKKLLIFLLPSSLITIIIIIMIVIIVIIQVIPNSILKTGENIANFVTDFKSVYIGDDARDYVDNIPLTDKEVMASIYMLLEKKCISAYNDTIDKIEQKIMASPNTNNNNISDYAYDYDLSMSTLSDRDSLSDTIFTMMACIDCNFSYDDTTYDAIVNVINNYDSNNLYTYTTTERTVTINEPATDFVYEKAEVINGIQYYKPKKNSNGEFEKRVYKSVDGNFVDNYKGANVTVSDAMGHTHPDIRYYISGKKKVTSKTKTIKYLDINLIQPSQDAAYDMCWFKPDDIYAYDGSTKKDSQNSSSQTTYRDIVEIKKQIFEEFIDIKLIDKYQMSALDQKTIATLLDKIENNDSKLTFYNDTDTSYKDKSKKIKLSSKRQNLICNALSLLGTVQYDQMGIPKNKGWNKQWETPRKGLSSIGYLQWVCWTAGLPSSVYAPLASVEGIEKNCTELAGKEQLIPGDIGIKMTTDEKNKSDYKGEIVVGIYLGKTSSGKEVWISCNSITGMVSTLTSKNDLEAIIKELKKNNLLNLVSDFNTEQSIEYKNLKKRYSEFTHYYRLPGIDSDKTDGIKFSTYENKVNIVSDNDTYLLAQFIDTAEQGKLGTDVSIAMAEVVMNRAKSKSFKYSDGSNIKQAIDSIFNEYVYTLYDIDDKGEKNENNDNELKKINQKKMYFSNPSLFQLAIADSVINGEQSSLKSFVASVQGKSESDKDDITNITDESICDKIFYFNYDRKRNADADKNLGSDPYYVRINTVTFYAVH